MRSGADRDHSSQLAIPARPAHRRLRPDSKTVHRMTAAAGAAANRSGTQSVRRMPAEWERHKATWIAWPHHEPDWPGKLAAIPPVYGEIVRAIAPHERVEILCND